MKSEKGKEIFSKIKRKDEMMDYFLEFVND
jgi:hypothetical protein